MGVLGKERSKVVGLGLKKKKKKDRGAEGFLELIGEIFWRGNKNTKAG